MVSSVLILSRQREEGQAMRQRILAHFGTGVQADLETDPLRALQIQAERYEMIILDLELDGINAFQLLGLLKNRAPKAVFVGVSESAHDLVRWQALQAGAAQVIPRPSSPETWNDALDALERATEPAPPELTVEGSAAEATAAPSIRDLVTSECLSANSTHIAIEAPGHTGDLFIYQGELYHAQCPGACGAAAVDRMLGWPAAGLRLLAHPLRQIPPRTIELPWHDLIGTAPPPPDPEVMPAPPDFAQPSEMAIVEAPARPLADLDLQRGTQKLPTAVGGRHLTQTGSLIQPHEGFSCPSLVSCWNTDLLGCVLGGQNVADVEAAGQLTYFIFRHLAEAAVALDLDYFNRLTLFGENVHQEVIADNIGLSHAVFRADRATQADRDAFVAWCYGKHV